MAEVKKDAPAPAEKKGNGGLIVLIILLVLALGGIGFLFYQNGELSAELEDTKSQLTESNNNVDDLTSDLDAQIEEYKVLAAQYDSLGYDNSELQDLIAGLEDEKQSLRAQLNSSNADRNALRRKVKKLLAESELTKQEYQEKIERLTFAVDSLGEEIDVLYSERADMVIQNATLEQKVAVASVLRTKNQEIYFLSPKGKEVKKDIYKASKIKTLIVKCNLEKNAVAAQDKKDFVLRIVEPSGNVLFSLETGGGSFEDANGETKFYTQKTNFLYDNSGQPLNFTYEKGDQYLAGDHKVEIYAEGYKIWEGSFVIK